MKMMMVTGALAALTAVGCAKSNEDIKNEGDKAGTRAQMAGLWTSPCDSKNLLWEAVGVKSGKTVYDFFGETGKTIQLFSDAQCTNLVGQATYTGTATIGNPTAAESSNILDLNYTKVEVMVQDQATVDLLNNPATPGCGISDWKVNVVHDVTANAGGLNCPIAKPAQVFDIVKTDGESLHFGAVDAEHDKSVEGKRPVALDKEVTYKKQTP